MMSYDEELIRQGKCPELVMYRDEDGMHDGRCMGAIEPGGYACPGHTAQIEEWSRQSEAERLEWERRIEMDDNGPW